MKHDAILRLSKLCLPMLLGDTVPAADGWTREDLKVDTVQRLWGGMGHIYRVSLTHGGDRGGVAPNDDGCFIVKHICPPPVPQQNFGDRRKARSYEVEAAFYTGLADRLIHEHGLALPRPLHVEHHHDATHDRHEIVICMSHVASARGQGRRMSDQDYTRAVLAWLATLHAAFWGEKRVDAIVDQVGLQEQGSYWYLDTRPDEHDNMPSRGWEGRLKRAARAIDDRLKRDEMQCLLHGDAKDANVIVTEAGVAMCDFQYCGKGPPTKDLAYFLCTSADVRDEGPLLELYLAELARRLPAGAAPPPTLAQLRESLEVAYCDFARFMSGWGYWGGNLQARVTRVLDRLDGGKDLGSEEAYEAAMQREFG